MAESPTNADPSLSASASASAGSGTLDPLELLTAGFLDAIRSLDPDADDDAALITPSKRPELGDFQSNAAMPLAKRLGRKPRDVAVELVKALKLDHIAEPLDESNIAGPGFINVRLRSEALASLLGILDTPHLGLEPEDSAEHVVVDVCGVNLAKQMHVGHLRATVIGDTIARINERLGRRVTRQNHVGDWGLPIAMVTAKLRREAQAGRVNLDEIDLTTLDRLYKAAQAECRGQKQAIAIAEKYDMGPKILAELNAQQDEADEHLSDAKRTLVALQSGDEATVELWQRIYDTTMRACLEACRRLNTRITDEHSAGESSYRSELAEVVTDLSSRGVAIESDGALVVPVEEVGIQEPCLVRKSDGGYLYATTDLAGVRRRVQLLEADRVIYCVDARQSLHFRQVFAAATKAGYASRQDRTAPASLEHAAFGMVLGDDGRPFKTRSGENVRLSDLLDEAVNSAQAVVREKNPELDDASAATIAEAVGIAAIKYTDLANDRVKDYVFSFERMLAFEGNTGPYLLNALVRIRSIFRRAEERGVGEGFRTTPLMIAEPAERKLALALLRYPQTVRAAGAFSEPHRVCTLLYDIASAYSVFYEHCPVLAAKSDAIRDARLRLCDLTGRVLADGLEVLGLPTLERM